MTANLYKTFVRKVKNGNYICTPFNIQSVSNGPDAYRICDMVAHRYAYQLSFMPATRDASPVVDTQHGAVRVHSRVTVTDTGVYFKDNDGRGGYRRRAWLSRVRDVMSKTQPTMPGYITW